MVEIKRKIIFFGFFYLVLRYIKIVMIGIVIKFCGKVWFKYFFLYVCVFMFLCVWDYMFVYIGYKLILGVIIFNFIY